MTHVGRRILSSGKASLLQGVFAPVPSIFRGDKSQSIDVDAIRTNLNALNQGQTIGLCALGTNGEFPLLSESERELVLETVAQVGSELGVPLIAGTGTPGTQMTISNTKKAADIGYDAAMVVTPYYFTSRMNDETLLRHFQTVADQSPIPIVLYNMPSQAGGVKLSPSCVATLAKHENIIGIKDSGGTPLDVKDYVEATEAEDFHVVAGSAGGLVDSVANGATGGIMALTNLLGPQLVSLYNDTIFALEQGLSLDGVRARNQDLVHLNRLVTAEHSVAGLKHALDLQPGFIGGSARSPHLPLKETAATEIAEALAAVGRKSETVPL